MNRLTGEGETKMTVEGTHLDRKGKDAFTAEVLRRLVAAQDRIELDPWLALPQSSCCYSFGPEKKPLPIGALRWLWSCGFPLVQAGPECGGTLLTVGFGGLLSIGGLVMVCPDCEGDFTHSIGGLAVTGSFVADRLAGSGFDITGMVYGGVVSSRGHELLEILGLPSEHPPRPDACKLEISTHRGVVPLRRELDADGLG
jgi:hypothetical protein